MIAILYFILMSIRCFFGIIYKIIDMEQTNKNAVEKIVLKNTLKKQTCPKWFFAMIVKRKQIPQITIY